MTPDKSKKVLIYCPAPNLPQGGGAERQIRTIAEGLAALGHEVVFVSNASMQIWDGMEHSSSGIRLVNLKCSRLQAVRHLFTLVRREKPHALLSTCLSGNLANLIIKRLLGGTFVSVIRSEAYMSRYLTSPSRTQRRSGKILKSLLKYADAVVAQNRSMAVDLQGLSPDATVKVIHNAHDTSMIQKIAQEDVVHPWFQDNSIPIILIAARLMPIKDIPCLINAFDIVRKQRECRLVIMGEGPEKENLHRLINALSLTHLVDLIGHKDNPYKYISRAQILALSSISEGSGNVLMEALILGTQVVSTDFKVGASDVLEDGRLGRLAEVGSPEKLAAALLRTLDSPIDPQLLKTSAIAKYDKDQSVRSYADALYL